MAKKDLFVKIRVNNSGLDFEDDVDIVILTVPAEVKEIDVLNKLEEIDTEFHRDEDKDGNYQDCYYAMHGYNYNTLLDELCKRTGWAYKTLYPNIDFEIK